MLPFSPPYIDQAIIDEVVAALQSGWITTGPRTKALEQAVCEFTNVPRALCVNSATAGMELVLRWFGVSEGDEVIVPAYTYAATANVVMHCGAKPVMVDVYPDDLTMNCAALRNAITARTKAIIPVDLGGMPCKYDEIRAIIAEKALLFQPNSDLQAKFGRPLLMADAAHSLGARYKGKPAAMATDVAVYSFHAVKNLTTAEGGCIALNFAEDNDAVYNDLYRKSLHGQTKDALAKVGKNAWEYDIVEAGYKFNMPDILAAIGLAGMRNYPALLAQRKAITEQYDALLSRYDWAQLPIFSTEDRLSSFHLYLLRLKNSSLAQRNAIIAEIFEQEVAVNVHYKPLPLLSFYKNAGYLLSDYPISEAAWETVITLPLYPQLTEHQVLQVVEAVATAVAKIGL